MRKVISLFVVSLPMVSLAYYTRMANGIMWTFDVKDGKAMIVEGENGSSIPRGTLGDIVIPETLAGCPVTSIESYAFHGCQALTSVTIPETVTHIKSWAFMYCTGLTSVMIPSSVTEIGDCAFRDCCSLESVTIPRGVTYIGNGAFVGCSCLESVTFLAREAKVWYSAFDGCNRLKAVYIEDLTAWCSIQFLEPYANPLRYAHKLFIEGKEVVDLRIPNGVENIGSFSFEYCSGLKSVSIPLSVTSIGASAFSGCSGLTTVYVASKDAERVAALYPFDKSVKFVDPFLPTGLMASDGAFADRVCVSWTDAKDAISHDIYRSTTQNRPAMATETNVTSPYNDTSAEPGVEYHYWVAAVNSSGSVISSVEMGYRAVSLSLGKSTDVYEMGGGNGNVSVEANANWSAVSDADWITFGTSSGSGNGTLTYMIAANATASTRTGTITVTAGANTPHPVTKEIVVTQDAGLPPPAAPTDVNASDGLHEDRVCVSWSAAVGATSYNVYRSTTPNRPAVAIETNVTSPYNDTSAEPGVEYHYWVAAVNSSGSVVSSVEMGYRAVSLSLDKMTDVYESSGGDGYVSIAGNTLWNAISDVSWINLERDSGSGNAILRYTVATNKATIARTGTIMVVAGPGTSYPVTNTVVVSQEGAPEFVVVNGVVVQYIGNGGAVTIPSGVTAIGERAFLNCEDLKSVTIPSTVISIGDYAFWGCCALKTVKMYEGVVDIGRSAFYNCSELTSLALPPSVKHIGDYAFQGCGMLVSVTISEGVTSIGHGAFAECGGLSSMTIPSSVVNIGGSAFYKCTGMTSITIPSSIGNIGDSVFEDCSGLKSVSLPEGVTRIMYGAFSGCSGLKSVTIPSSVLSIETYAFYGCGGLRSVSVPEGVESIGWHAFSFCGGLNSVAIPKSVTSIGGSAFLLCNELKVVYVDKGDGERVRSLYEWPEQVKFVEIVPPTIEGDEGATVTGDAETGFVIKPSDGKTAVEVTIPQGVDAVKVTVEVSAKVASVKPNGAKVKVVVGDSDITGFLVIPESEGALNVANATVKEEIVKEALDPSKDAVIELNAANPQLITAPTRKGLTYTLYEGRKLESLSKGDSKLGDGDPWKPTITVSGGDAAFYSIDVSK